VTLEVADDEPGPFALKLPGGEVILAASGRRRFATVVPEVAAGVVPAVLVTPDGIEEATTLAVPDQTGSGREGRAVDPDVALLARVAEMSGGRIDPEPTDVVAPRSGTTSESMPLLRLLIPLALAAVLGDVALRRRAA
jgi:hypothetical protein